MADSDQPKPSRPKNEKVTVVAGALDEISNIGTFIDQVIHSLELRYDFEIVVVDDNSADGTREYLSARSELDRRIVPIFNEERKGLLCSHLQGIAISQGNYIVVMDSDLQHPPDKIIEIVEELRSGSDIAVCSRYVEGGSAGKRSPVRGIISRVAALLGRLALRRNDVAKDSVSGFFGFISKTRVPPLSFHFSFKTLLYVSAQNPNAKIKEIPFTFGNRVSGKSKIVNSWKFIPAYLVEVINIERIASSARRSFKLNHSSSVTKFTDSPFIKEE